MNNYETTLYDAGEVFSGQKSNTPIKGFKVPSHNTPAVDDSFIFGELAKDLVVFFLQDGPDPLYLFGDTGTGKSSLVRQVAARLNYPVWETTGSERLEVSDLIGHLTLKGGEMSFMDGPLVAAIVDELEAIKLEFQKEKALFLADYSAIVQDWIARHPQWETMLASSVPSVDYVSSKLLFGWKSFRFSIAKDSNIAGDVAKLADSVFADIARQASEAYRDVFADRTQLTQRSLGPLRVMETKLAGLQFIEPRVAQAAQLIRTALDEAPDKGPIQGVDLSRLLGLVCLLRDAEALEDYTTRMMDGQSASGLLAGLAAPLSVAESPVASVMRQSAVIASQGLW